MVETGRKCDFGWSMFNIVFFYLFVNLRTLSVRCRDFELFMSSTYTFVELSQERNGADAYAEAIGVFFRSSSTLSIHFLFLSFPLYCLYDRTDFLQFESFSFFLLLSLSLSVFFAYLVHQSNWHFFVRLMCLTRSIDWYRESELAVIHVAI